MIRLLRSLISETPLLEGALGALLFLIAVDRAKEMAGLITSMSATT